MGRAWLVAAACVQFLASAPGAAQAVQDKPPASYIVTFSSVTHGRDIPSQSSDAVTTIRVRAGLARIDYPADQIVWMLPGAYYLYDARRDRGTYVLPTQKAFVVLDSVAIHKSVATAMGGMHPRFTAVIAFRDSLGAGETIEGFTSQKFRIGMGFGMQPDRNEVSIDARIETETESHVSVAITALDPGFSAFVRSVNAENGGGSGAAMFGSDTAMQRAIAMTKPARGFPIVHNSVIRTITMDDTSTVTTSIRMTSFKRAFVKPDDLVVPKDYRAIDMAGLARMQREMFQPDRGVMPPQRP